MLPFDRFFAAYPNNRQPVGEPRAHRGGFSGGAVWRVETAAGSAALRVWPSGYPAERIPMIHRLLQQARANGCDVVPTPIADNLGRTVQFIDGQAWELCAWMPGAADFGKDPSDDRLQAAAVTLARWRQSLTPERMGADADLLGTSDTAAAFRLCQAISSPGIARRASEWQRLSQLIESEERLDRFADPLGLAERTRHVVTKYRHAVEESLQRARQAVSLAVCLRDPHGEHVLFTGSKVTGLIDFGAVGIDTPACDLGRLLGSLVPDLPPRWRTAIAAYRRVVPLGDFEMELAWIFDKVGAVIGALHWSEWLVIQRRSFADPSAAYARWESLLHRIERWPTGAAFTLSEGETLAMGHDGGLQ